MSAAISTSTEKSKDSFEISISLTVRFWLFVIPNSLSIVCSFFVLYQLLFDRALRQALYNHAIIVGLLAGLIYELTTVPLMLHYFRVGNTWKLTPLFSRSWTFIDNLCYTVQITSFAWASIERHILIFHTQWISTKKSRFFLHYFPLIALMNYCFLYHIVSALVLFCGNSDDLSPFNGVPHPCAFFHPILSQWDTVCHQFIPTLVIVLFSALLLVRILRQKACSTSHGQFCNSFFYLVCQQMDLKMSTMEF